jgi:hypothetical protein
MKASVQENQCFLAELMSGNLGIYTIREQWRLVDDVDVSRLRDAFFYVLKSSVNLNRVFYFDDDSVLNSRETDSIPLWSTDDIEFNMQEAPLIRAGMYEKDGEKFFKIQFHHSLMDGWSLGLFIKDLQNAYAQKSISFVNNLKSYVDSFQEFVPKNRKWKRYDFLSDSVDPESEGTIIHLNERTVEKLKRESIENRTTLFPLLISKISKMMLALSGETSAEYAIPFSARNNSNINDIGMFVDTQLLELNTISPAEIQNKLLELISTPNSLYKYSGSPKIMLNFLDLNTLKFALSKDGYPISYVPKYALFDLQLEFRNVGNRLDVSVTHRVGVLNDKNTFYEKIENCLSGESDD